MARHGPVMPSVSLQVARAMATTVGAQTDDVVQFPPVPPAAQPPPAPALRVVEDAAVQAGQPMEAGQLDADENV